MVDLIVASGYLAESVFYYSTLSAKSARKINKLTLLFAKFKVQIAFSSRLLENFYAENFFGPNHDGPHSRHWIPDNI